MDEVSVTEAEESWIALELSKPCLLLHTQISCLEKLWVVIGAAEEPTKITKLVHQLTFPFNFPSGFAGKIIELPIQNNDHKIKGLRKFIGKLSPIDQMDC